MAGLAKANILIKGELEHRSATIAKVQELCKYVRMFIKADTFRAWSDAGYPRPQLCRPSWTSLNGLWEFAPDLQDVGISQSWYNRSEVFADSIVVPYPVGSLLSQWSGEVPDICWYRRVVRPDEVQGTGSKVVVHFEAVDFVADVWVNGQHVVRHEGGFTPFEVVIDFASIVDGMVLVVRAEDRAEDIDKPRGKQDWNEEPHGIWYQQSVGIWRDVWVERVPETSIASVSWSSDLDRALVTADVTLRGAVSPNSTLCIELSMGSRLLAKATVLTSVTHSQVTLNIPCLRNRHEWDELAWSPDHPNLVDARVTYHDPVSDDQVLSYLGVRKISLDNRYLQVNRMPVFQRGVLDQGYWEESYFTAPSHEAILEDLRLVRDLGFNMVRVHERSADRRYLTWADRLGIMVWCESASAYGFSPLAVQRTLAEWVALVARDKSHPSIVVWVPFNESWGVSSIADVPEQRHFVNALVSATRALDPTRPVIANDGWEQLDTDIVSTHDYGSTGQELEIAYQDVEAIRQTVSGTGPQGRRILLSTTWQDDKPIMVTEFGGISLQESFKDAWGYRVAKTKEGFEANLAELFAALYASPVLGGICYTQLTDTGQETNGLCDANRKPKLPTASIHSIVTNTEPHRSQIRPRTITEVRASSPVLARE
ncbi:glycoside hydrolase family 2 protein [Actinomyces minihominis]|uniref:glycoside hydrolase family 2 protein n=1 Tax=Actinomyces minihominis TaxID=2002838 RepID=UPI000C082D8B|nr:glycoside hydrolase family 2 TIM barrel-domain containing protein [Actinomyces minihominis]